MKGRKEKTILKPAKKKMLLSLVHPLYGTTFQLNIQEGVKVTIIEKD